MMVVLTHSAKSVHFAGDGDHDVNGSHGLSTRSIDSTKSNPFGNLFDNLDDSNTPQSTAILDAFGNTWMSSSNVSSFDGQDQTFAAALHFEETGKRLGC
jgi:hypothetical protein